MYHCNVQQWKFPLSLKETSITPSNFVQIWKLMAVSESAKLSQIQLSGTVLESSGWADSETAINFHIWTRFEGVIEVSLGDNWNFHCCIGYIAWIQSGKKFTEKILF